MRCAMLHKPQSDLVHPRLDELEKIEFVVDDANVAVAFKNLHCRARHSFGHIARLLNRGDELIFVGREAQSRHFDFAQARSNIVAPQNLDPPDVAKTSDRTALFAELPKVLVECR